MARHVGLDLSKILTPLWISSMMVNFDFSKACCRSLFQWNLLLAGVPGKVALRQSSVLARWQLKLIRVAL